MTDLFDKLRQMQNKRKTFDELPDMAIDASEDGLKKFDLSKLREDSFNGIKADFERNGKKAPEMKVVGISLHVIMLNPDDPKREEIAHTEVMAWHKKCGDPRRFMGDNDDECHCGDSGGCSSSCKDPDEQPYRPNKLKDDSRMYG